MVSTRYYPRGIKIPTPHKYVDLRSYKRLSDPEIIRKCMNCLDIWAMLLSYRLILMRLLIALQKLLRDC